MEQMQLPLPEAAANTIDALSRAYEDVRAKLKSQQEYEEVLTEQMAVTLDHSSCHCPRCSALRITFRVRK